MCSPRKAARTPSPATVVAKGSCEGVDVDIGGSLCGVNVVHRLPVLLRLGPASAFFLLLGLISSARLAFLAGRVTRFAFLLPLRMPPSSPDEDEMTLPSSRSDAMMTPEEIAVQDQVIPSLGAGTARLPSGKHLFVDVRCDFAVHEGSAPFPISERFLADALTALVESEPRLAMLSFHCHPLAAARALGPTTAGVAPPGESASCVAILLDGHATLHARTSPGGPAGFHLDLFVHGHGHGDVDLVALLPSAEMLLQAADTEERKACEVRWGHKLRGFRQGYSHSAHNDNNATTATEAAPYRLDKNPYDQELGQDVLRRSDFIHKERLASTRTKYQSVDVWALHHPLGASHAGLGRGRGARRAAAASRRPLSSEEDGGLESLVLMERQGVEAEREKEMKEDRALYIDGVLQSSLHGEAAYHEALVHPAMLSHPRPARVAIIGGGEGATLREVLKHHSVEEVVMIEIDQELTDIARRYLPEWSDCSDMITDSVSCGSGCDKEAMPLLSSSSCFDDPRARVRSEDAFGYFIRNFGENDSDDDIVNNDDDEDEFDVIIMDALDPDDYGEFVDKLYNDTDFIRSLYNGLTEYGVLVAQVGEVLGLSYPPDEMSPFYNRAAMLHKLEEVGFRRVRTYDEGHGHFFAPWQFLVAFRDGSPGANSWHDNVAKLEIVLHQRLGRTGFGWPALRYFDGPAMSSYLIPPRVVERNHCRGVDVPLECEGRPEQPGLGEGFGDARAIFQRSTLALEESTAKVIKNLNHRLIWASNKLSSVAALFNGSCNNSSGWTKIFVYSPVIDRRAQKQNLCIGDTML